MNVALFNKDGQIREHLAPPQIDPRVLLVASGLIITLQVVIIVLLALLLGG